MKKVYWREKGTKKWYVGYITHRGDMIHISRHMSGSPFVVYLQRDVELRSY